MGVTAFCRWSSEFGLGSGVPKLVKIEIIEAGHEPSLRVVNSGGEHQVGTLQALYGRMFFPREATGTHLQPQRFVACMEETEPTPEPTVAPALRKLSL